MRLKGFDLSKCDAEILIKIKDDTTETWLKVNFPDGNYAWFKAVSDSYLSLKKEKELDAMIKNRRRHK